MVSEMNNLLRRDSRKGMTEEISPRYNYKIITIINTAGKAVADG